MKSKSNHSFNNRRNDSGNLGVPQNITGVKRLNFSTECLGLGIESTGITLIHQPAG